MTFEVVHDVDRATWWEVAEACPSATFYESPLWHELVEDSLPNHEDRTCALAVHGEVVAVLPQVVVGRSQLGPSKKISTFAGCYGGMVAPQPVSEAERSFLYSRVLSGPVDKLQVNENPFRSDPSQLPPGVELVAEDFTQVISLDQDFEEILSGFSDARRNGMHKAERLGVKVRRAEDMADYQAYYGAYEDSLERWGEDDAVRHPWSLFERGCEMAQAYPKHLQLWLAEVDGDVASGAWVFYWGEYVNYWHGASYARYLDHSPNDLLHPTIMQDAKRKGYRIYDFNPSGGHEGVVEFKRRFGAEKRFFRRWWLETPVYRQLRRTRGWLSTLMSRLEAPFPNVDDAEGET